jgi:hypothetical protein
MITPIEHGDESLAVESLQRALASLGHDLPRYGVDGQAGSETFAAFDEFCLAHGLPEFADTIPTIAVELVIAFAAVAGHAPAKPAPPGLPGPWLHDFRELHVDRIGGSRDWADVTGITLHQTATNFSDETPERERRALQRVSKIRAHFVILRGGAAAFNAPLTRYMAHGHAFNRHDVGIEIDGYYAGVEGDPATFWKPKSRPNRKPMGASEIQIEHAREVCRYIVETVAAHGGEVRHVHAHRQTAKRKPSDPGELIWREVGLWCEDQLGLSDGGAEFYVPHHRHKRRGGLSSKAGPGRPIPKEWDPNNVHPYRWRPKK